MKGSALAPVLIFLLALAGLMYLGFRYQRGNLELARGNPEAAERSFRALLARDPQDHAARRRLAEALFRQERYAEAAGELERIFANRAPLPEEYLLHALAVIGAGDRARGDALLRVFPHPVYRVAEAVREAAAALGDEPPPVMRKRLQEAWRRGEDLERRERRG